MTIKVTFEFDTPEAAAAFLLDSEASAPDAGTLERTASKPRGRPRKDAAAPADAPAAQPAAADSAAPAASTTAAAPATASTAAVDFKAVADAITELADKDLAAAKGVLAKYGVANARGLKPEQFAGVVADAKAAMAPAPAAGGLI